MTYNPDTYADTVRLAGNAFRNADGKASTWGQESLAALLLGKLTLHAIALKLYDEMSPLTAKGKPAAPSEKDDGTISVSSIRNCRGGEQAKAAFGALQYIHSNAGCNDTTRQLANDFAVKGGRIFSVVAAIKAEKARIAKEQADAAGSSETEKEGGEDTPADTVTESAAVRIAAFNEWLATMTLETLDDSAQLALVQTAQAIAALSQAETVVAIAA